VNHPPAPGGAVTVPNSLDQLLGDPDPAGVHHKHVRVGQPGRSDVEHVGAVLGQRPALWVRGPLFGGAHHCSALAGLGQRFLERLAVPARQRGRNGFALAGAAAPRMVP
jgi:hypothetical protein